MTATMFDHRMAKIESGERLSDDEIRELTSAPDVLAPGMLADALRRRLRGTTVTFLRVAECAIDRPIADEVPAAAREILLTGAPASLDFATRTLERVRAVAGARTVVGFSWPDVERLAGATGSAAAMVLETLRQAGLDGLAELPLDLMSDPMMAVDRVRTAGFQQLRLTVSAGDVQDRTALWRLASELQDRFACIQTLNPLPSSLRASGPTTGYHDVKTMAAARLAAPNIPSLQVDWARYGPKLAQVALSFGADDVYGVSAAESTSDARRRGPLEEIRRNIAAAGLEAAERDGRFTLVG